ncbi:quinone oxidoreductase [Phanerochaete sordida]|uniref:Probable quinone oxidoreductase n=1 Tax=Phanerochaete sordida TaxID=48140 RepID=A0A9P3LBR8_9APHY|nr:quinone oxidoreductase [Phanerochaete sordida]
MSFPSTIHAIAFDRQGGPEVLEKKTLPFPKQQPNEIVIKINYGGVNTVDTYMRKGLYPVTSFPYVLGTEGSGTVVALPTDPKVLDDPHYKARGYKIGQRVAVGDRGAHAEYISNDWVHVIPVPDEVSLDVASAVLCQGLTVITLMTEAYDVQKGDTIFIHTVAGGLGLLFAAYAKSRGATVIGTTSSPEKAEIAKSYGADHVILYTKENTVQRTLELTNGEGVHAIFDGVGKDTFLSNFEMLRRKGTLVCVGNASGPPDPVSPLKLSAKNLKLVRPSMPNYIVKPEETDHYAKELWDVVRSGLFKVRIERVVPFSAEGVREAHAELTTPGGKLAGKILIKIADE